MAFSAAIVFPGQGSQHLNMLSQGGILDIAQSSEYLYLVDSCSDLIQEDFFGLIEKGPEDILHKTSVTQPVLLLTSYFHFLKLLDNVKVEPTLFAGHSLGEYTALVAAKSLNIEDALELVRQRGELMELAPKGSMAAILGMDHSAIKGICEEISADDSDSVQCANLNSPVQTVISGLQHSVERAQNLCLEHGAKRAIKLKVSIASHSSLMKQAAESFYEYLSTISIDSPQNRLIHNVGCTEATSTQEIVELLAMQLYSPVEWVKTTNIIKESGVMAIECGPGKVLGGLMKSNGIQTYFSTSDTQFYEKITNHDK